MNDLPMCDVCGKPVDQVVKTYDSFGRKWTFSAFCHGKVDTCSVDERSFAVSRVVYPGTAFRKVEAQIVHKPEFLVTRELVESTPSPLEPAAIVYAESEKMRQECQRRIAGAMCLPADVFQGEMSLTPSPEFERSIVDAIKHDSPQRSYAATDRTIAKIPPISVEEVKETCRLMRLQLDNLRAREKATLDRLTGVYSGWPVAPIIAELDRLGFKVYLNIDYDPPCSGNAIVLLASKGKLVQFKSIHWGLQNECK